MTLPVDGALQPIPHKLVVDWLHSERREYHCMMLAKYVPVEVEDGFVPVGLSWEAEGGHTVGPYRCLLYVIGRMLSYNQ
jgi:hypothetical protein